MLRYLLQFLVISPWVQASASILSSRSLNRSPSYEYRDGVLYEISDANPARPDIFEELPPICALSESDSFEYCVFTSTRFANGRGISILARRDRAMKFLSLPAFTNPEKHAALGANDFSNTAFYEAELPGRGIGLIANRTIKRGEWLMSTTPAFIMDYEVEDALSLKERLYFQRLAFERLPSQLRDRSYGLHGQTGLKAADLIEDVLDTNTFGLPVELQSSKPSKSGDSGGDSGGDEWQPRWNSSEHENDDQDEEEEDDDVDDGEESTRDYKFLFPEIARFNHDCRPSADYYFDPSLLVQHIIAHRDIFAGEELTITYIHTLQRQRARQKALRRSWGFTCDCRFCADTSDGVDASDARVDKILEIQAELEDRSSTSKGSPQLAEQLVRLLQKEQLWSLMRDGYASAAIEYSGVGDELNAQRYASMALRRGHICRADYQADSEQHRDLVQLLNDPRSHQTWQFRLH